MQRKKTERITLSQYNDQMMDDAYVMLVEALKEVRKAEEKVDKAITTIIKARVDEE